MSHKEEAQGISTAGLHDGREGGARAKLAPPGQGDPDKGPQGIAGEIVSFANFSPELAEEMSHQAERNLAGVKYEGEQPPGGKWPIQGCKEITTLPPESPERASES